MRTQRTSSGEQTRRLGIQTPWICLIAGVFVIALSAGPGARVSFAQSASTQSEAAQAEASAAQPKAAVETKPAESKQGETTAGASNGQAPSQDQAAKPEVKAAAAGAGQADAGLANVGQSEILDETANLLKLANTLKAEVDKTTQDTLSLAVIREAGEIEKLAHKMRTK